MGLVVLYRIELVHLSVVPFKLVAYAVLSYGVAVVVATSPRGALAGLLGTFSCSECLTPLFAVLADVVGGSMALAMVTRDMTTVYDEILRTTTPDLNYYRMIVSDVQSDDELIYPMGDGEGSF